MRCEQRNGQRVAFNRTEAFIALKDKRDVKSAESLTPAFRILVDHNYLRPLDCPRECEARSDPGNVHGEPDLGAITAGMSPWNPHN